MQPARRTIRSSQPRFHRQLPATAIVAPFILMGWLLIVSPPAVGDECVPPNVRTLFGDTIGLRYGSAVPHRVVEEAVAMWRRCANYDEDFPGFRRGSGGFRTIEIRRFRRNSESAVCGVFDGRTIVVYEEARGPGGTTLSCGSLSQNLAHELGHVLGLGDLPDRRRCPVQIMGWITASSRHRRRVSSGECAAAGASWLTRSEWKAAEARGYVSGDATSATLAAADALVKRDRALGNRRQDGW